MNAAAAQVEKAPEGVNPNIPNVARMYDYFLGGKDNFAADREQAELVAKQVPEVRLVAQANRRFLGRAVRALAKSGIHQFIDFGSGLPTAKNVHEIAQGVNPDSRTVYVDTDPMVCVHGRALLAYDGNSVMIQADVRDVQSVLLMPEVTRRIDFDQPVAMLTVALTHFIEDDAEVAAIYDVLAQKLADKSRLVLSHVSPEGLTDNQLRASTQLYKGTNAPLTPRDEKRIVALLPGWEWEPPGLVPVAEWRTHADEAKNNATRAKVVGGIAIPPPRKPSPAGAAAA
ncbi:SAM-dependent methyltransferase [Nonomuraea sp. NPDC003707]